MREGGGTNQELVREFQAPWSSGKPLVSVIVPCFNYGAYLRQALDSIHNQTFQDFEILVVESGSTDGVTAEILNQLDQPKTKIFRRTKRYFVGDNRNYGIGKAQGKYICCLDADDYLEPTFLEKSLFLAECGRFDIVSTSYRRFEGDDLVVILPRRPSFAHVVGGAAMPSVALLRKEYWRKLGGYRDTGIGALHIPEDWDLLVRAVGDGARLINLQEPLLHVRWHSGSLNRSPENLSAEEQRLEIKRRNKDCIKHANFETFSKRNESVFWIENALTNLASRQNLTLGPACIFLMPDCTADEKTCLEMFSRLAPVLEQMVREKRLVLLWKDNESPGQRAVQAECSRMTKDLFPLGALTEDKDLQKLLLQYLATSRGVTEFFTVSGTCDLQRSNLFQMIDQFGLPQ